jgi:hypothetical protein
LENTVDGNNLKSLLIVLAAFVVWIMPLAFGSNLLDKADKGNTSIQHGSFPSPLLKRDIQFRVFAPTTAVPLNKYGYPLAVYVKNPGFERIGTVPDRELIDSFLSKGMLVVEVDYQNDRKARGADMYADIVHMYRIFGADKGIDPEKRNFGPLMDEHIDWNPEKIKTYNKFTVVRDGKKQEYKINPLWVYVIPAGYTIERDIKVSAIETSKRSTVHRMDVIYPARPVRTVPAILKISAARPVAGFYFTRLNKGMTIDQIDAILEPEDSQAHTRISRGACYVYAWTMAGYAAVILDNVASVETSPWLYGKHTTVPTGKHFPEKRALRLIRAHKAKYGLSGKVAVMGMSKCNIRTVMSALVNDEHPSDKYCIEFDKGPYSKMSDRFDAMIVGGVPWPNKNWPMILDYLSEDDPPLVWCETVYTRRMKRNNYVEKLNAKEDFLQSEILKRCAKFNIPCKTFFGTPIGHDFDYIHLRDIITFLDQYMK